MRKADSKGCMCLDEEPFSEAASGLGFRVLYGGCENYGSTILGVPMIRVCSILGVFILGAYTGAPLLGETTIHPLNAFLSLESLR